MANVQDIRLTDNDLEIQDGDFVITYSDQQHIQDIVESYPGCYKEFPLLGVGIRQYINSAGTQVELQSLIQLQLESDGYTVNNILIANEGQIEIDAERI